MDHMQIFNTLTRKKEEFKPMEEGTLQNVCLRPYGLQLHSYR